MTITQADLDALSDKLDEAEARADAAQEQAAKAMRQALSLLERINELPSPIKHWRDDNGFVKSTECRWCRYRWYPTGAPEAHAPDCLYLLRPKPTIKRTTP